MKLIEEWIDLASERLGGVVLAANDEFFAPKENLLRVAKPVWFEDRFTTRGKWMDGWESRRRRTAGHDWCAVLLGIRGVIRGVDVDTTHFSGNHPSHCSVDAIDSRRPLTGAVLAAEGPPWQRILAASPLRGDSHNL